MNEKINKGLIITVILLIMVILGLVGFIIYDNSANNTNRTDVEENDKTNDIEYNYSEIDKLLNENLSNYINFRVSTDGTNALNTSDGRLELVNSILMELELSNWYDDGQLQSFPYVKYDTYKEKYNELFGNSNNLEQDLKKVSGPVANDCSDISSLSGNNICWNGTWGTTDNNIKLKSEKILKIAGNSYKVTGTYVNEFNNENGVFEIEYFKTSNTKYLTSIKLTKNN